MDVNNLYIYEVYGQSRGIVYAKNKKDAELKVREAYKNYFSDARDFIRLIEEGCEKLYANALLLDTLDKYNTDKDTTVNAKKLYFPTVFNLRSVSCK